MSYGLEFYYVNSQFRLSSGLILQHVYIAVWGCWPDKCLGWQDSTDKQPKKNLKQTGESPFLPGHCKLFSDHLNVLLVLLPYLVVLGIWLASEVEQNKIQLCTATP